MTTIQQQIETLRAELHRHNHNYYVLNAPEITDFEFDRMTPTPVKIMEVLLSQLTINPIFLSSVSVAIFIL